MPDDRPHDRLRRRETPVPSILLVVLGVVLVEAGALAVVAGLTVRAVLRGEAASTGVAAGIVVLSLLVAALLVAAGRALFAGRRWGRAPVLTWQLLQAAVAVPALRSDQPLTPALLLAASVVVVVGLFLPAVVRHTTAEDGSPPDSVT